MKTIHVIYKIFCNKRMNLEGLVRSKISQTEKDKHYVISQSQSLRNRWERWLPEAENGENREMLSEGTSIYKENNSWESNVQYGDYNYQCHIFYLKVSKNVDLRCSHHTHTDICMGVWSVSQSCLTLCDPMDCSPIGPSVHGILKQEYWSRFSFPLSGDLPNSGMEPTCVSPASAGKFFATEPSGKPS